MEQVYLIYKKELASAISNAIKENIEELQPKSAKLQAPQNNKKSKPKLLTIKDLQGIFGVSRVTINKWMKEGKLPFIKMSRRVYFNEDEIYSSLRNFNFSKMDNFKD